MEISTPCSQLDAHEHGHEVYSDPPSPDPTLNQNPFDIPIIDVPGETPQQNGLPSFVNTAEVKPTKKSFLNIKIEKILVQTIWEGVEINSFSACTGHFVCGSSYALISTANDCVKVWKLQKDPDDEVLEFKEWNSMKAQKEGTLLQASAAYSGRIACVYKLGRGEHLDNFIKKAETGAPPPVDDRYTCAITVYECESTGGELKFEFTVSCPSIENSRADLHKRPWSPTPPEFLKIIGL
jgi:hypothetical protein